MKATAKLIYILMISAVCCVYFSLCASAKVYTSSEENYSWSVDLNSLSMTIEGSGALPDYANHEEAPYAKFLPIIKTLTVEDGITSIGKSAFMYASSLESVILPESVTSIGQSAFEFCFKLKQINLPSNLKTIDSMAFSSCRALDGITLPEGLESLGTYAFCDCASLTQINLPSSITTLSAGTFSGCKALTTVAGLENVSVIEEAAFYGCESLDSATFSQSAAIASRAFFGCSSLGVTVPLNAYSTEGAFYNSNVFFNVKWNIGSRVETSTVAINQVPIYKDEPVKDCVLDGIYLFSGWNKPFTAATATGSEYTANFKLAKPIISSSFTISDSQVNVSACLNLSGITSDNAYILFACYDENSGMISSKRVAVAKNDTAAYAVLDLRGRALSHVKAFIYTDASCLTPLGESVTASKQ